MGGSLRKKRAAAKSGEGGLARAGVRVRMRAVRVFGLTGGIASGKSAVAARLRSRGVPVIDADVLAREVVLPGTDGLAAVVSAFGAGVLAEDGGLDRKKLAAMVFGDEEARRRLNAILHPRIQAASLAQASALAALGEPLACYEAALLVEGGLADAFRPLVVVAAPEHLQLARAAARDGATDAEVRARVAAQMPLASKVAVADIVIHNDATLDALHAQTDLALEAVCRATSVDPARYLGRATDERATERSPERSPEDERAPHPSSD